MDIYISEIKGSDIEHISKLISRALMQTCSRDYDPLRIDELIGAHAPDDLRRMFSTRLAVAARIDDIPVGCASLEKDEFFSNIAYVKTVFVDPDHQGSGTGEKLMRVIEEKAADSGINFLRLCSSFTAYAFYLKLGYCKTDTFTCPGGTIPMKKQIPQKRDLQSL